MLSQIKRYIFHDLSKIKIILTELQLLFQTSTTQDQEI
jgi:hypothetical protein